eukprot:m.486972 g.486972  ORF g.486972 m.486972 type:complete len:462 (+) comp24719_c0_seq1:177-1562(+)
MADEAQTADATTSAPTSASAMLPAATPIDSQPTVVSPSTSSQAKTVAGAADLASESVVDTELHSVSDQQLSSTQWPDEQLPRGRSHSNASCCSVEELQRNTSRRRNRPRTLSASIPLYSGQAPKDLLAHRYTPQRPIKPRSAHGSAEDVHSSPLSSLEGEKPCSYFTDILKQHQCYDMMAESGKIVVFDTQLKVKKAFFALVQNGIRSAPCWDSTTQQFVGIITVSDFIRILRHSYVSPLVQMDQLEDHKIQTWRDMATGQSRPLVCITPMASLYDAAEMLLQHRIHRLPVIDEASGNALMILTHKRLLALLYAFLNDAPAETKLDKGIKSLGIGTYNNVATISPETAVIVALDIFSERRISALPIVSAEGKVVDIYAKHDVINLARERTYTNLDVSVDEALRHRMEHFEGVRTCQADETLRQVIERIVLAQVHRLVIVDSNEHLVGVVSLSDILSHLIRT